MLFSRLLYLMYLYIPCAIKLYFNGITENSIRSLRSVIEQSGPVCIKISQWLCQRPYYFDSNLIKELGDLQTMCPPQEHRLDILSQFKKAELIGTGSIANVYKCTLDNDENDRPIIIKIRHPNIENQLAEDLAIIKSAIILANNFGYNISITQFMNDIVSQCNMNYEATNLTDLSQVFEGSDTYFFPKLIDSTNEYIKETYIEGISDVELYNKYGRDVYLDGKIKLFTAFFIMLHNNILHGDFHNGNIIYNVVNSSVKINFVDFGLVVRISDEEKDIVKNLFRSYFSMCITGSTERMITHLRRISKTPIEDKKYKEFITKILSACVRNNEMILFNSSKVRDVFNDVFRFMNENNIEIHDNILYIIMAFIIIENDISARFGFNFIKALTKYLDDNKLYYILF